jgi:hypothetical protein
MSLLSYLRIWLACARYSVVRTMMFRFDFIMWSLVEFLWMAVNLLLVAVIYAHTDEIAGWSQYEMLLLVGTSMLVQRFIMGFFWSNLFEFARNVRSGHFDFFLAQPGNPLFMVSTRKLDLDGLARLEDFVRDLRGGVVLVSHDREFLARSVTRFGVETKGVGKAQLLVPVVLVVAAARLPVLEILPAVLGFLLYKPALIVQAVLDT